MTRPSSASAPEDLFEAIAKQLEPSQRAYFYQRMLYFRQLRPEDELLRLVEAIGLLALLIREAPQAVAREREQLAQLLKTSLATIQAAAEAEQAYQQQLDDRLTRLPTDLAQGISPEAIARAITESLRQQFVQSGVPATADALTAIAQQLTHATAQLQRAAGQLTACTGIAAQARDAMDQMSASVSRATGAAQWTIAEFKDQFRVECIQAVWVLCGAAWLFGIFGGVAFEMWRGARVEVVPQAIAVPAPMTAPSSTTEPTPKKPTPAPVRDRHREPQKPKPHGENAEPARGTCVERGSNSGGTVPGSEDTKPEA